jgi:hypothetical protein
VPLADASPQPDAPSGDAVPLADAPPKPDAPPVEDKLDLQPVAAIPVDVTAATVDDFVKNANARMGGTEVGHMQPDISWKGETEGQGPLAKVTKVHLVVKTEIARPRWAGGHPKPTGKELELIHKAERLIKEHEDRHRDKCHENMKECFKQMHGKSPAQAQKIFDDFLKKMENEQKALDAREGLLIVKHEGPGGASGPATDVVLGPKSKEN